MDTPEPTFRQTVVYIDDMMMSDGRTEWATKLATKLKATLAPGERVTVVRLSPASGQSNEVWSACWPGYTAAERQQLAAGTYIFSRNPLTELDDQEKFFASGLSAALGSIYQDAKRPAAVVRIDPAHPPTKNILRALTSDEARFSQSQNTVRAIIFSDLAENSDLGSVFKPLPREREDIGRKLGTHLRRSVFYAYGLSEDVAGAPSLIDNLRKFWAPTLQSMQAAVGGLGADLNVPNEIPVRGYAFTVAVQHAGQTLEGRLSVLVSIDGTLVDSWLDISRLSIASLAGSFQCQGTDDPVCKLDARTNTGLTTSSATENVSLSGSLSSGLKGEIGVPSSLTDPIDAHLAVR